MHSLLEFCREDLIYFHGILNSFAYFDRAFFNLRGVEMIACASQRDAIAAKALKMWSAHGPDSFIPARMTDDGSIYRRNSHFPVWFCADGVDAL
jgi:hypothetical protein